MSDASRFSPAPFSPAQDVCADAVLTIDLGAVAANYRALRTRLGQGSSRQAACGAVLKADAYGLGAGAVAPVLAAVGCRHFFVAQIGEGIALRRHVAPTATVYVLHGVPPGAEADALAHALTPVLNSLGQVAAWARLARARARPLPAALQVDTGMARFGLAPGAVERYIAGDDAAWLDLRLVMSHLACADIPANAANEDQRARFDTLRRQLPPAPASLAASSGIFLGAPYHYDLARAGAALFGVAPVAGAPNPLRPVVRLDARVIQMRDVPGDTPIGYGHTARTSRPARLATIGVGYADGYLRSAGNKGAAWFEGIALPVTGRVSMDSLVLDATAVPPERLREGAWVELIGPHRTVDVVAADAGTIGYEILTGLGRRYDRRYMPALEATRDGEEGTA